MQEQERGKQKIESLFKQRLSEIDSELDDIMHIHKARFEHSQKLGDILPGLFSQEELQEEKKIALGEISERKIKDFAIKKLENASEYDINSENSIPSMNLDDLSGTQKLVFQRLLELRKKVYKYQHDETTCSEGYSTEMLPSELRTMSEIHLNKNIFQALSKTCEATKATNNSILFSTQAGLIFGMLGSEKYRTGLTNLLKSDKLSISERENIVYNLINGQIQNKTKTVDNADIIKQENWGDMSSIHAETKEIEISQDLEHIFSKASISLSKGFLDTNENQEFEEKKNELAEEQLKEFDDIFKNEEIEFNKPSINLGESEIPKVKNIEEEIKSEIKTEIDASKDAEFSEMSIIKEFSRNYSISTKRRMSEESKKDASLIEAEDVISSRRKFSIEQREPSPSILIPVKTNLFFVPEPLSRPRSNPRVALRPEEFSKSREESLEESLNVFPKVFNKGQLDGNRKPISMINKLPILPKPPPELKKITIKSFRGRSLQPIKQNSVRTIHQSPPTRKPGQTENKSTSPGTAIKFRMRRFKEVVVNGLKNSKGLPTPSKPSVAKKSNK